jgi:predicted RNase H-like nuclease
MKTTFIGVDLAWQGKTNHTGIAIARATDRGGVLTSVSIGISSFEAVVDFIDAHATADTVVAIDAPLIIANETGQRPCEKRISRDFGSRHAGAHSTNLRMFPDGGPARVASMLASRGFAHDLDIDRAARRGGRWIFEVYPHPAQVVLFNLEKIIRYKKGSLMRRRAGLEMLRGYLGSLARAEPALDPGEVGAAILDEDLNALRGEALKRYEDLLDAWFCSYLALHLWWWGGQRNEMVGDLLTGYIVVPKVSQGVSTPLEDANVLVLPPGTRVVARNPLVIAETGKCLPAGAVGVIVRAPAEGLGTYRIRFPDSSEASLGRRDLIILKTVKEGGLQQAIRDSGVDWQEFVIYKCIVGSRAYGLEEDASDVDRRGFYLPPADLQWSLYGVPEQLENEATQETYWEIEKFMRLALKANPNVLECLYTPLVEHATELARELLSIRQIFLSKLAYQTYNGYVLSQFKRLEQDLRTRGAIKWKHAMHLVRLLLSGITILREGHVPVRVAEHRERLLAIRRGEMPWEEVDRWRLSLHAAFDEAFRSSALQGQPDFARANAFLIRARRSMVSP